MQGCKYYKPQQAKKSFFGDSNSNGPQYSKVIIFICLIVAVVSFITSFLGSFFMLSETVATALIAAGGAIGMTAVVFYLKKSQAENTIKLYLYSYKEILKLKKEDGDLEFIDMAGEDMLTKINSTLDVALEDATSPIERQDIM